MKIYDSLSADIINLDKKELNIYSCGPTVYNYIHIGNARPSITMDIMVRFLKHKNVKVNYLQNITDVDDKIINKAIEQGVDESVISKMYTDAFIADLQSLNVQMPTKLIPISEKMDLMIKFIEDLVKTNDAYVVDGDVYFDIKKWEAKYGQLSGRKIDELIAGDRVDIDNKKHNPLDFNLWKKTEIGIKWDSPFGAGRPGWHTECVLLIDDYFNGETIDIHAGGIDLKFPHHENERIQFWAHNNKEIADAWVHNGHLTMSGEKMSKSLGNVILTKDFVAEHGPNLLRWIFMTTNYKQPLNISYDLINQGIKFFEKLNNLRKKIIAAVATDQVKIERSLIENSPVLALFDEYMNDDLNTPMVLSLIESLIKDINTMITNVQVNELDQILNTLGFKDAFNISLTVADKKLFVEWKQLLANKEFDQADKLRDQLKEKGLI